MPVHSKNKAEVQPTLWGNKKKYRITYKKNIQATNLIFVRNHVPQALIIYWPDKNFTSKLSAKNPTI